MTDVTKLLTEIESSRQCHERDVETVAGLLELLSSGRTSEEVASNLAKAVDFDLRKAIATLTSLETGVSAALRLLAMSVALEIKERGGKQ